MVTLFYIALQKIKGDAVKIVLAPNTFPASSGGRNRRTTRQQHSSGPTLCRYSAQFDPD